MSAPAFQIETVTDDAGTRLAVDLSGEWLFDNASDVETTLESLNVADAGRVEFRCAGLEQIDLTGAWLLYSKSLELEEQGRTTEFTGFKDVHMKFLSHVIERPVSDDEPPPAKRGVFLSLMAFTGKGAYDFVHQLGEMTMMMLRMTKPPTCQQKIDRYRDIKAL